MGLKGILSLLYTQILTRPIFNLLIIFLAIFGGNLGVSIVVLTLIFRLIMIKYTSAGNQMQHSMGDLQPKLNEIQEKYKDNPSKMAEETMKVFKTEGKSPLKGCLRMLIQIPIFLGLYTVIRKMTGGTIPTDWLYSFFYSFGSKFLDTAELNSNIQSTFLGMDLFETKNLILAILTGALTLIQMKLTTLVQPKTAKNLPNGQSMPDMSKMTGMMGIVMAFMMGSVVYSTQAGIGIYLITTTLFSVLQYSRQYKSLLYAKRLEFRGKPQVIKK